MNPLPVAATPRAPQPALVLRSGPAPDLPWFALTLAAVLAIHVFTLSAMASIWLRSATFAHGLLIVPISCWLVWRRRAELVSVPRRPWPLALLPLAVLTALWLLAALANVQVLQQYCVIGMIAAVTAAVLGRACARAMAFPLAYLLLAVPFGEILIPPLIDFTSRFVVVALQISGIPVFRENNFLSLPSGNWSVIDACSGLRYVMASLALGALFAHLNYRGTGRRMAFISVSLLVPVLANGMRAYLIVLIGHSSNMRLAAGIDHLLYGWLFFGLVSLLLFWLGARWRDQPAFRFTVPVPPGPPGPSGLPAPERAGAAGAAGAAGGIVAMATPVPTTGISAAIAGMGAIALAACGPLLASLIVRTATPNALAAAPTAWSLADAPAPWRASALRDDDWHLLHAGRRQAVAAAYTDGVARVTVQLTWYPHQAKGAELLAPVHRRIVAGMPEWHEVSAIRRRLELGSRHIDVQQLVVQAGAGKLLVWRWYRQDGRETASPQVVKLLLAKNKLLGQSDSGAEFALATPYDDQPEAAAADLRRLLAALLPAIDRGIEQKTEHAIEHAIEQGLRDAATPP